jgi:hypothetical protein
VEYRPGIKEQQDLAIQRIGLPALGVRVDGIEVRWPRQDARKTRPVECPQNANRDIRDPLPSCLPVVA